MSRGLDFTPRGAVLARFTHLQYTPFVYRVQVNNQNKTNKLGTCRIFMAPKNDERGLPMVFAEQKDMMIELDKFAVNRELLSLPKCSCILLLILILSYSQ